MIQPDKLETLQYWMRERENIRELKDAGQRRPWSGDPIFRDYKFCNVRREDDAVTKWFAQHWRNEKYWNEPNFIPAVILGRTINWPATLARIGFPHEWEPEKFKVEMDAIQNSGGKVYTGAYMITAGPPGVRKNDWVLGNAKSYFKNPPKMYTSIQATWEGIMNAKYPCVGPFIAGQVIADLKQTKHLAEAYDWYSWAAIGPGSARGLNRLQGRAVLFPVNQTHGLREMQELKVVLKTELCLQDVQNCLCEFDKYLRVKQGEGKPRSGYAGRGA